MKNGAESPSDKLSRTSLFSIEKASGSLTDSEVIDHASAGGAVGYAYDDGPLIGSGSFVITGNAGNGLPEAVVDGTLNLTRSFNAYGEAQGAGFHHQQ